MLPRVRLAFLTSALALVCAVLVIAPTAGAEHHEQAAPTAAGQAIPRTPRPADAKLYIISPAGGEAVSNPVTIRFGLAGMGVAPAGVASPNTGHHHLIIDAPLPPLDAPLPKDDKHLHFGGGQTEVTMTLAPGSHTIQLVLGDKDHVPHDPPLLSEPVTFTVR